MHELSIARSILEHVRREVKPGDLAKVTGVHVTVGPLSHVEPTNLRFCFDSLKETSGLSAATLLVTKTGLTATCKRCGKQFEVICGDFRCPDCTLADVELPGYDELTLTAIDLEEHDEEENGSKS